MHFKKQELRTFVTEPYCDKCGSKMVDAGLDHYNPPSQYQLICTNLECNNKEIINELYPKIAYEVIQ